MSIKLFLSTDHKDCDEVFADTENTIADGNWSEAAKNYERLLFAFDKHFRMEEEVMFLEFEEHSGMSCGPTQVMRAEHAQMRMALEKLKDAVNAQNKNKALGVCETFNLLVQQHNSKEEQILYTMADQVLGAFADDVVLKMKNV